MKPWRCLLPAVLAVLTGGCATIVDGGGQVISVNTVPSGASCTFDRNGHRIGMIASTPGTLAVDKSRKTIVVTCDKPGYQTVMGSDASQAGGMIFGNLIFGSVIGVIVDLATGADYEYGSSIFVTFPPKLSPVAQMPPPSGAPGV